MTIHIRNVAIIAHVDHGKTTLVDKLLAQTGTISGQHTERVMDSNELEQERGITILAKNTAIEWKGHTINLVDTPGHADFGGEVERILSMVDSVLLLVDAVEGPMPQTRFVTQKAFEKGLKPIVVVNKIDREGARPDWVMDQVFELFDSLGATDEQLDFPMVYASAIQGFACEEWENPSTDMSFLLDMLLEKVSPPDVTLDGSLQMQISALDYSSYVGTIGIGRIQRGELVANQQVLVAEPDGKTRKGRVLQVLGYKGLERNPIEKASAGDIVAISGITPLFIGETICPNVPAEVEPLPAITVEEPTVGMIFQVNDSPFAGKDGDYLTSRQIQERLDKELLHNVALRVEPTDSPEKFRVLGRGELHLSILIETMRREGFEFAVSKPEVVVREIDGEKSEPYERLTIDVPDEYQGAVMESLGKRMATLQDMHLSNGRARLDFSVPTRGLIGFHGQFLSLTSGNGIMTHSFDHFGPYQAEKQVSRPQGVLISMANGSATAYSLWNLQARGRMFIPPQTEVYEGMIVGIHQRDNDLVVNVTKEKQLTNIRAAGTDENMILTPPIKLSLEQALEFIENDELVEVTPKAIRLRKKLLKEHERKRQSRS